MKSQRDGRLGSPDTPWDQFSPKTPLSVRWGVLVAG